MLILTVLSTDGRTLVLNDNIPFDHYIEHNGNGTDEYKQWVLSNCFNDIKNEKEKLYQQLRMLLYANNEKQIRSIDANEDCDDGYRLHFHI